MSEIDEVADLKFQIQELQLARDYCTVERDVALVQLRTETERCLFLEKRIEAMREMLEK